ncbi:hypothetical protein [Primorskyibacter sp. 2E233]|uniref:hypothetical protein n=1 Tax=Primorskyibacter sp. 2E233 TaxID=3413431 RepID=UPI003BF5FF3E
MRASPGFTESRQFVLEISGGNLGRTRMDTFRKMFGADKGLIKMRARSVNTTEIAFSAIDMMCPALQIVEGSALHTDDQFRIPR